jgi:bidirectional [NiFe] hydrogenase diaphorase subunit
MVETTMRRHGFQPRALIETLHSAQEAYGYLEIEPMRKIAKGLRVPFSRVYGVATFYHYFTLKPQGKHTCVVCTGTACYIKGAQQLLNALDDSFKVKAGETTADKKLSILTARCFGSCGLAPAVVIDGEVGGKIKPGEVVDKIKALMHTNP